MKKLKSFIIHLFLLSFIISLIACQAPKDKDSGWSSSTGEVRPGPKTGKAVLALLRKARQASKEGALNEAESHLERALRIEPQNPTLWLYMAKLRLYGAKSGEAINLAKKALALSSRANSYDHQSPRALQADCWRVIAHANQKMGDFQKARIAEDKVKSLTY